MKWLALIITAAVFVSSCNPPLTGATALSKEPIKSASQECTKLGNSWDTLKGEYFCNEKTSDSGTRCRSSKECEGFCQGSKEATSSGTCSQFKKRVGCVLIVERGERHEVCYK